MYYRFGGRGVAWHNNTELRHLLSDHLSSSHAEVGGNQAGLSVPCYAAWQPEVGAPDEAVLEVLHRHQWMGRVLGGEHFIETFEATPAGKRRPGKPGSRRR